MTTSLPTCNHPADPGDAPSFAQCGRRLRVRDAQGRQQAENETHCQRQPEEEYQRAKVERRWERDRGIGDQPEQPCPEDERHHEARKSASDRQQRTFSQQLPDQTTAPSPEREPYRHLAAPRRGAG
jgi:hypothetical protein